MGETVENPIDPKEWDGILKIIDKMSILEAYERGDVPPVETEKEQEKTEQPETIVDGENMFEKRSRAVRDKLNGQPTSKTSKA